MKLDPTAYATLDPDTLHEGDTVPPLELTVSYAEVVMGSAATGAYFGGHIEPDYARRQGRRNIYLATGPILGLVDRYVTAWAGPLAFVQKRTTAMRESICADDAIAVSGTVSRLAREPRGVVVDGEVAIVVVDVAVTNQLGQTCATAQVTLQVPAEQDVAS